MRHQGGHSGNAQQIGADGRTVWPSAGCSRALPDEFSTTTSTAKRSTAQRKSGRPTEVIGWTFVIWSVPDGPFFPFKWRPSAARPARVHGSRPSLSLSIRQLVKFRRPSCLSTTLFWRPGGPASSSPAPPWATLRSKSVGSTTCAVVPSAGRPKSDQRLESSETCWKT